MRALRLGWALTLAAGLGLAAPLRLRALLNIPLREEFESAVSKRVARDAQGRIYLLTLSAHGQEMGIRVGPASAATLEDFSAPIQFRDLVRPGDEVQAAGMAIDGGDRLHLVWNTAKGRVAYGWCNIKKVGTGAPSVVVLAEADARLGDITLDAGGAVWIAWMSSGPGHQTTHFLGAWKDGKWRAGKLISGIGFFPPSLSVSGGRWRLGWHDVFEDCRMMSGDAAQWPPGASGEPVLLSNGRAELDGGFRPVSVQTPGGTMLMARENAYNELEYLAPGDAPSRFANVARFDHRFAWDTLHSPSFATDCYGIPWMFFIDSARQHVFYARWLGTRWSEFDDGGWLTKNSARLEDNHLPIDRISVEESAHGTGRNIAVLLGNEGSSPAAEFRRIAVPHVKSDRGRTIRFLDLKEIASLDRIRVGFNHPRKIGQVIGPGQPGDMDSDRVGRFLRVLKESGKYRMWYSAVHVDPREPWWDWDRLGYAESAEGRSFHRVNLGLGGFNGKADSNMIPALWRAFPAICRDPSDPGPGRYKILDMPNTGAQDAAARAGLLDAWDGRRLKGRLFSSPDGIAWQSSPAVMDFPAGRPGELIPESMIYDARDPDPRKRYKLYGFSSLNLSRRGGAYAYSPDARHWTACAKNPVLDPFAGDTPPVRGGKVQQIHDMVVWREGGTFLALYEYQRDGANLDLRLAASRDGENFDFVRPDDPFLPMGTPQEWDHGMLTPSVPVIDGDEIKIYYSATYYQDYVKGEESAALTKAYGGLGLAILRLDGYTDLEPDPGSAEGTAATIPIQSGTATHVYANAACAQGSLEAELVDPSTGQPIPGYSREECVGLGGDGTAQELAWKGHSGLSGLTGRYQVRIYFHGTNGFPKLYALAFK